MSSVNTVMLVGLISGIDVKEDSVRFLLETQDLKETKVYTQSTLVVYRGKRKDEVLPQLIDGLKVYVGGKLTSSQVPDKSGKNYKLSYVQGFEFEIM